MTANIRWMIRRDFADVLQIEQSVFKHPWSETSFQYYLRRGDTIGMVLEEHKYEYIIGYMIYTLHRTSIEIQNFAIAASVQRSGYGSLMLQRILSRLSQTRRSRINIQICESNIPGLLFFKHHGFRATGLVKSPYDECDDDGINMIFRLPVTDIQPAFSMAS